MLAGEARIGLDAALHLLPESAAATTNIRRYLTLSEQIADRPREEPHDAQLGNEATREVGVSTDERPSGHPQEGEETSRARSVAERLQQSVDLSLEAGRLDEAVTAQRRVVESFEQDLGDDAPVTLDAMTKLAGILVPIGQLEEAGLLYQHVVDSYRRLAQAQSDPFISKLAGSLVQLSACLQNLGRYAEALPAAEEAVTTFRQLANEQPDQFGPVLIALLDNLADILTALNYFLISPPSFPCLHSSLWRASDASPPDRVLTPFANRRSRCDTIVCQGLTQSNSTNWCGASRTARRAMA